MSEYIPDLVITSEQYVSLNALSLIPVGTSFIIQCKGSRPVRLVESSTKPLATVTDGSIITGINKDYAIATIPLGSLEIWALCASNSPDVSSKLNVQAI